MDISTGLLIWAAEAATLAVLLLSRWFSAREDFYLSWAGGFALHGIGVALVAVRGSIPDFLSIEIANTIALAGVGLWIAGLLQFDRKPVEPYIAIPPLIWIAGMFLDPVRESYASRVALYNVAAIAGYAMLIGALLAEVDVSRRTRRILAGLIAAQLCTSGVSGIMALASQASSFSNAPNGAWLFVPSAFFVVASILTGAKLIGERTEEKLKALAVTDPLTGVLNRRGLIEAYHHVSTADRTDRPAIALLHFDLDHFKQINDRYGHQAGDAVLVAFSRVGQTALRGRGSFGRMGGEEFASLLRVRDMIEAASVAEAIRLTLKRQPIVARGHGIRVTVSVGIALAPVNEADLDFLLGAADRALYTAKQSGRDRAAVYADGNVSVIPAADLQDRGEEPDDLRASQQVAALKRLAALGKH